MGIGKRLKEQLKLKDMPVKRLAEITEIPPTTLYSIINRDSNNVNQEILDKISSALSIDSSYLLYDSVGKKLERFREESGLTQSQLAEMVGLASETLQQYELNKQQPTMKILHKIAKALNISISHLVWQGGGEPPEPWRCVATPYGSYRLSKKEELDCIFNQLNSTGQAEAVKRIRELTYIEEYTKKEE